MCGCVYCLGIENTAANKLSVVLGEYTKKNGIKYCSSAVGGRRGGGREGRRLGRAEQRGETIGILPTVKSVKRAERDRTS